jgi:hypothetical protein
VGVIQKPRGFSARLTRARERRRAVYARAQAACVSVRARDLVFTHGGYSVPRRLEADKLAAMGKKELVEIVQSVAPLDLLQANSLSGNPANVAKKANKVGPGASLKKTRIASRGRQNCMLSRSRVTRHARVHVSFMCPCSPPFGAIIGDGRCAFLCAAPRPKARTRMKHSYTRALSGQDHRGVQ